MRWWWEGHWSCPVGRGVCTGVASSGGGRRVQVLGADGRGELQVSPVVEAALGALREAEHRSTFYFPYWKIPGLGAEWPIPPLVPRQLKFQNDMKLLRGVLDEVPSCLQTA